MPEVDKFAECLERIVGSKNEKDASDEWISLEKMENSESGKNSTNDFNRNYDKLLRNILTESRIENVSQIPLLLDWFSKFPLPDNASHPISKDIASCLVRTAENFKMDDLAKIIDIINENTSKYLPTYNNHGELCTAIVEVLSFVNVPKENQEEIRKYVENLGKVKSFFKTIIDKKGDVQENISIACFKKLCEIILKKKNRKKASSALVIIFELVDVDSWKRYMGSVFEHIRKESNSRGIVEMLNLFCEWLVQPPDSHMIYLSTWLTLFITASDPVLPAISMELAHMALPTVFTQCISIPAFYEIREKDNIIYNLLKKIGSLNEAHRMMEMIYTLLRSYPNPSQQGAVLKQIALEALNSYRFRDHIVKDCGTCLKLNNELMRENNQSRNSHIVEENEEMEVSYPSTSSGLGKLDTGKVGLQNLGNTCYMNSVLQALVMTKQFCHRVLLYKSTSDLNNQTVLKNLQNLFALLKYSQKSVLAPTEILKSCRPAYFMPGQQQDSSEFLCHLLDVMYEQEKSALAQNSEKNLRVKSKIKDKEMVDIEEASGMSNSLLNDNDTSRTMSRWHTEENLSEGASLQRKTQSLADFTGG